VRALALLWRVEEHMDEDSFNMAVRKFLKEVGVTSQREIERVVREKKVNGSQLRLKMTLTSNTAPELNHVIEHTIDLK
jgi:16S rRNA U516 pseudouridylate synthase RsuA-like enzyme